MTNRMTIALCAVMMLLGTTFAQEPIAAPSEPPQSSTGVPTNPFPWSYAAEAGAYPEQGLWVTGDYLFSWFVGSNSPPLVTTSPAGTSRAVAGIFGSPTTSILFGGNKLNTELRSGFRMEAGYWFGPDRSLGLEAGATILESQASLFAAASDGSTILARPYIDANTNTPQAVLIAFPGSSAGDVQVRANSGSFYEFHLDATENLCDQGRFRCNILIGYRYYRYDEGLNIRQNVFPTDPNFAPGTRIATVDNFNTRNVFNGADFGLRAQFLWQTLSVDLLTKLAVGRLQRTIGIEGNQVVSVPGVEPVTQTGGVLALTSNIGHYGNHDLTILPEIGLNLGWQVRPNLRLRFGYTLLYLHDIARATNQIDLSLNPNLFPAVGGAPAGVKRPVFILNRQDFAIQSFSTGLEFTF